MQESFLKFIQNHKKNKNFEQNLRLFVFDAYKNELTNDDFDSVAAEFGVICEILKKENLLNERNISALIDAISRAKTYQKEQYIHKLIFERDQIEKQIYSQAKDIQKDLIGVCKSIENSFSKSKKKDKFLILEVLGNRLFGGLEIFGILKDVSEAAFLTTIENGEDVEDTAFEISKNIVFRVIKESEFKKARILNISKCVISASVLVANESKIFAKELIFGAINGTKEGVLKAVETFKDEIKFAPSEISSEVAQNIKELKTIENEFIEMLKILSQNADEPSKSAICELLENSLDNYAARILRVKNELKELISVKFDEFKESDVSDLTKIANERFMAFRKEISQKTAQFLDSVEYESKKEELTNEARKFGNKIYEAAKMFIDQAKDSLGKKR